MSLPLIQAGGGGGSSTPSGSANQVYATPNGSSGSASLRSLVAADLPAPWADNIGAMWLCGWGLTQRWDVAETVIAIGGFNIAWMTMLPIIFKVTKITVNIGSAVSGNLYVGVYSLDGNTRYINGVIANGGVSGVKTITLGSPVTLAPGMYYVFVSGDTSVTVTGTALTSTTGQIWNKNFNRRVTTANGPSGGNCPTTLGALTGSAGGNMAIVVFE